MKWKLFKNRHLSLNFHKHDSLVDLIILAKSLQELYIWIKLSRNFIDTSQTTQVFRLTSKPSVQQTEILY